MARQPSSRRKRSADFQAPAAATTDRARRRRQQVKPVGQPKSQTGARREQGGFRSFVVESAGELKKVDWPGRRQVMSATVVVLIAVAVVGAYLWLVDEAFSRLVRDVLLKI